MTDGKQTDQHGRYSPDGKLIAFSSVRGGMPHIFVMPAHGGPARQVTPSDYAAVHPTWSPDGKRLAFECNKEGGNGIWAIDLDGRNETRITPTSLIAEWPDWSPDSKKIAFLRNQESRRDLFTIGVDGSALRQITNHKDDEWHPRWSPDGQEIAFYTTWDRKMTDLWVVPAEGGTPRQLTDHPAEDYQPAWSSDGKWLAFFSRRAGTTQIWAVPAQGGTAAPLTDEKSNLYGGMPTWSPDGKHIVFDLAARPHLFEVAVATGRERQLTRGNLLEQTPTFSPDGKWLLFVSTWFSAERVLTIRPANGGKARPLHSIQASGRVPEIQHMPRWSSDGKRMAFAKNYGGFYDSLEIWVADANGDNAKQLTHMGYVTSPVWCESDRSIVFSMIGIRGHVWKIPASGGTPVQLTEEVGSYVLTDYDPALNRILLHRSVDGVNKLFLLNPAGGKLEPLPTATTAADSARWSRDGSQLAYVSTDSGQPDIYVMPAKGGAARRLTNSVARESAPSWSPDGKRLVFSMSPEYSSIHKVSVSFPSKTGPHRRKPAASNRLRKNSFCCHSEPPKAERNLHFLWFFAKCRSLATLGMTPSSSFSAAC